MVMMKKATSQMLWVVVGAVMALVVLTVLLFIFTKNTGKVQLGFEDCATKSGQCITKAKCSNQEGRVIPTFSCNNDPDVSDDNKKICCFP